VQAEAHSLKQLAGLIPLEQITANIHSTQNSLNTREPGF
jgi:hypothetical protein